MYSPIKTLILVTSVIASLLIVLEKSQAQVKLYLKNPSEFKPDTNGTGLVSVNDPSIALSNTGVTKSYGSRAEGISTRYMTSNSQDIRGILQTFTWNKKSSLMGIGILIAKQGTVFRSEQEYQLDIQQLDAAKDPAVVADVKTFKVSVPASMVRAGQYLYLHFDTPVQLKEGQTYGINLFASSTADRQEIRFQKSNSNILGFGTQSGKGSVVKYRRMPESPDFNIYFTSN